MATAKRKKAARKKSTAQSRPKGQGSVLKGFKIFTAVLAVSIAIGIAGFCSWYFTGGGWFHGAIPATATVTVGEETYANGCGGLVLYSGTEIAVNRYFGEDYKIEITSDTETDFEFILGSEPYSWKDLAAQGITDFSAGFKIVKTEAGFKVEYDSLSEIIEAATETAAGLTTVPDGDIFYMTITCANRSITLSFCVTITEVTSVQLNPDQIIFG